MYWIQNIPFSFHYLCFHAMKHFVESFFSNFCFPIHLLKRIFNTTLKPGRYYSKRSRSPRSQSDGYVFHAAQPSEMTLTGMVCIKRQISAGTFRSHFSVWPPMQPFFDCASPSIEIWYHTLPVCIIVCFSYPTAQCAPNRPVNSWT